MDAVAEETRWGSWTPRVPLTAAEQRVDFPAHNEHIVQRRLAVERYAKPAARKIAYAVSEHGLPTNKLEQDLQGDLYVSLVRTVDFGYQQVRRELRTPRTIRASIRFPGIGQRGRVVLLGLEGIHGLVRSRAAMVASDVAEAAKSAAHKADTTPGITPVAKTLAVRDAVDRTLHNDVLQLIGEALNLGRAAAAMDALREGGAPPPLTAAAAGTAPEFAMRSEQLDENTCDECDALHGDIVQVGSAEFYDEMPPEGCAGGGRCRGLYVFGEGSEFAPTSTASDLAQSAYNRAARYEPGVTADLRRIAELRGGKLERLDFRLKTQDSLERKIVKEAEARGKGNADSAIRIKDALRYTMTLDESRYTADMQAVLGDFEAQGYRVSQVKNFWENANYHGINAVLETPDGYRFELQFHTQESLALAERGHLLYEKLRKMDPSSGEAQQINRELKDLWKRLGAPKGALRIGESRTK